MGADGPDLTPDETAELWRVYKSRKCDHCVLPGAVVGAYVPVPIETVKTGDPVTGSDGSAHSVTAAVSHAYNGGMRTITTSGTLPVTVTDEHQFLTFPALQRTKARSGWKWRQAVAPAGEHPVWREAAALHPGDYVAAPIPSFDGPEPPALWASPDRCWLLGLLAGDGYTSGRNLKNGTYARYYLGCVLSDARHVERAEAALQDFGLRVHITSRPGYWRLRSCSRQYAEAVHALIGSGSQFKCLPAFVWSSKDRLSAALEGLMDADGCVSHPKRTPDRTISKLLTTSLTLAWQAWSAAVALGERPFIRATRRCSGYANAHPGWTVEWTDTKVLTTARTDAFYVMPVRRIEAGTYDGTVHDLTVRSAHSFMINGLLTHNCLGAHARACPRVQRLEFHENGRLKSVTFWARGQWSDDGILWPEDIPGEPGG